MKVGVNFGVARVTEILVDQIFYVYVTGRQRGKEYHATQKKFTETLNSLTKEETVRAVLKNG